MTRVVRITQHDQVSTPDGKHRTRWRFHCDDGEIVDAALTTFVRDPFDRHKWRYHLLTLPSGATIEHVAGPVEQYIASTSTTRAAFGLLADAAAYAIGGAS